MAKERMLAESNVIDDECEEGEIRDDSCFEDLSSDETFSLDKGKNSFVEYQDRAEYSNRSSTLSCVPESFALKTKKMSSHVEMLQEKENRVATASDQSPKIVLHTKFRKRSRCDDFQNSPRKHRSLSDKSKQRHHNNTEGSNCYVLRRDMSQVPERTRVRKKHDMVPRHKMKAAHGKEAKSKKHHKKSNLDGIGEVCRKRMKRSRKRPGLVGQHTVSANTSLRRRLQNMGVTLPTLNLSTTSVPSLSPPPPPCAPSLPPPSSPVELLQSPQANTFPIEPVSADNNVNNDDVDGEIFVLPIPEKPPVEVIDILSSPEVVRGCKSPEDDLPPGDDNVECADQEVFEKVNEVSVEKPPANNNSTENSVNEGDANICVEDDEVLQLRLIALRSAILKKHQNRKKRVVSARQNQDAPEGNNRDLHHVSPVTTNEKVGNDEPDEITTLVDMELADTDEEREPSEANSINVNVPPVASNANTELSWVQSSTPAGAVPTSYVGCEPRGVVPYCTRPVGMELYENIHVAPLGQELVGRGATENAGGTVFVQSPSTSSCSLSSHCGSLPTTCQTVSHVEDHFVNQVRCESRPADETDEEHAAIDLASMIVLDEVGPEDDGPVNGNSGQEEPEEDEDVLRAKLLHTMTKSKQKQNIPDSTCVPLCPPHVGVSHTPQSLTLNGEHSQVDGTPINYATLSASVGVCCPGRESPRTDVPHIPIMMAGAEVKASVPSDHRSFRRVKHRAVLARQADRKVYNKKQLARALRYTRKKVNLSVSSSSQSLKVMVPVKAAPCPSPRFVICLEDDESDSEDEVSVPRVASETPPGPEGVDSEAPPELEARISMFLKEARMSQEAAHESAPIAQKTPTVVQHLPPSQRDEYRRLRDQVVKLEEMNRLRRLQLASASTKSLSPVHPVASRAEPADTAPAISAGDRVAWQAGAERMVTATNKLMVTISQQKNGGVGPAGSVNSGTPVSKHQTLGFKSSRVILKNIPVGNLNVRKNLFRKITSRETSLVRTQHRLPSVQNSSLSNFSPQKLVHQTSAGGSNSALQRKLDSGAKQVKNITKVISFGNNFKRINGSSTTVSESKVLSNPHANSQRKITLGNVPDASDRQTNKIASITQSTKSVRPNISAVKRKLESVPVQQLKTANVVQVDEKTPRSDARPGQVLVDGKQFTSGTGSEIDSFTSVHKSAEDVNESKRDSLLTATGGNNSQLGCIVQETVPSAQQTAGEVLAVVSDVKRDLLHDLEQKLHAQRCGVLEDMTSTWDLLHRIEQSKQEENACAAEVARLKAELSQAEQRLEAKRGHVADMRVQVVQVYGRVMKGKDSCKELGKRCHAVGASLHGKHYRVPNAREELMVSKLRQIANFTRQLSKKRTQSSVLSRCEVSPPMHDASCLDSLGAAPASESQVAAGEPADSPLAAVAGPSSNPGREVEAGTVGMEGVLEESPAAPDVGVQKELAAGVEQGQEGAVLLTRDYRGPVLGLEDDSAHLKQHAHCEWTQPTTHFWPSGSKWAGMIDHGRPLCPYELRGSCRDQECSYQHVWSAHS